MNLASIIDAHPADHSALISRNKVTTYGELRDQVAALRGGLVGLGLEPGDRVAIACGTNWYFVASYLATLGAGLVAVPLNPSAPAPELMKYLQVTGARVLVAGPAANHSVGGLDHTELPDLEHVVATAGVVFEGERSLDDLLAADPVPLVERGDDDIAALMFTSGTAGSPKAAVLTHGNLRANLEQMQAHLGRRQEPGDIALCVLPLFHIFGLNVVLGLSLYTGSTVLLVERFDPQSALEAVQKHKVTIISGPPTMWAAWANLPGADPRAFESVRLAASGAAKLPVEIAQLVEDRFGLVLKEGYGLTETSPVVATATGTNAPRGSVGSVLPGIEVRLVDADGEDVLVGDSGEIWVRGPNVFKGYWNDPDATAQALTSDGWLRTGDVAVVDDDGFLFLVDRAKDIIIVSGFNVYPAEVENVLIEHPAVEACAVVGVPHPYTGEAVKAFVVLREGISAEEDDIIAWCSERLARYKCPDKVMFVDELPKGVAGKVLRRALR
ncbi:MAG: long-chain fatty acid--CoA ligase [Acidimicrobiales bacterium]|nr:long-chain fatty acid--CoA ligase [Acidimicrobiales bacterium]